MPVPTIGLIVPPAEPYLPPDAPHLYGDRATFVVEGLGITEMTSAAFDAASDRIAVAARRLAERGAQVIAMMGTSLSFYRGVGFNDALEDAMTSASGLPSITTSTAVVQALRALGAVRVAVGAAYEADVNDRLRAFLEAVGLEVASLVALGIRDVRATTRVGEAALIALGAEALAAAQGRAEALFISCGGFTTAPLIAPLEERCGVPVVSSAPAALWAAMRLASASPAVPGCGRLLASAAP